jgi:hypothetical protein
VNFPAMFGANRRLLCSQLPTAVAGAVSRPFEPHLFRLPDGSGHPDRDRRFHRGLPISAGITSGNHTQPESESQHPRAKGVGHFFDQFSADLLTLAASRTLKELNIARAHGNQAEIEAAVKRLETRYICVTAPGKKYCGHPNKSPAERIGVIFLKPQMLQSIFANRIDQSHC